MKTIKQLLLKLTDKDSERYGDILPYAWISFNPDDLEEYGKEVLIFYTKEDYSKNKGVVSYISDEISEDIYMYECTPLT
jgi:hypothetical protein